MRFLRAAHSIACRDVAKQKMGLAPELVSSHHSLRFGLLYRAICLDILAFSRADAHGPYPVGTSSWRIALSDYPASLVLLHAPCCVPLAIQITGGSFRFSEDRTLPNML